MSYQDCAIIQNEMFEELEKAETDSDVMSVSEKYNIGVRYLQMAIAYADYLEFKKD